MECLYYEYIAHVLVQQKTYIGLSVQEDSGLFQEADIITHLYVSIKSV